MVVQSSQIRSLFSLALLSVLLGSAYLGSIVDGRTGAGSSHFTMNKKELLKKEVIGMIKHSWNGYIKYAFPQDELDPTSCTGFNSQGGYALTVIDSLDTLALIGEHGEFRKYVDWVLENVRARRDVNVSVFETNIRVVGGLLSAHFFLKEGLAGERDLVKDKEREDRLLLMSQRFADRLLPAFTESPSGIPFGTLNLHHGVWPDEIDVTATASATTFSMEFLVLSVLTGNPKYERAARKALRAIWESRSSTLGLVGNHINITSGEWTVKQFGPGTGIDSFLEYLVKTFILTGSGDLEFWHIYDEVRHKVERFCKKGPWRFEVDIEKGTNAQAAHNSLASFYAGNLVMTGRLAEAKEAVEAAHNIFRRFGAIPEGFNLHTNEPMQGQLGYPLRPEHIESIYMLYRATKDPSYLSMGEELLRALQIRTQTACGYSALKIVQIPNNMQRKAYQEYLAAHPEKKGRVIGEDGSFPIQLMGNAAAQEFADRMDSFWISETLKYFYLLFAEDNHPFFVGTDASSTDSTTAPPRWVFNTEGHPFPIDDKWGAWLDAYYDPKIHRQSGGTNHFFQHYVLERQKKALSKARGHGDSDDDKEDIDKELHMRRQVVQTTEEGGKALEKLRERLRRKLRKEEKGKTIPTAESSLPTTLPKRQKKMTVPLQEDSYESMRCPRGRRSTLFQNRRSQHGNRLE